MFAPIINVIRMVLGVKKFNSVRGKLISIHSQIIGDFCKYIGANQKIRQGLIRVAKANGAKLGLLQ